MANVKISDLTISTTISDSDVIPVVTSATTKKIAASSIKTYVRLLSYSTPSTAIDLTSQLAMLEDSNSNGAAKNYTLANGTEGQIMYFAWKQYTSGGNVPRNVNITVTVATARIPSLDKGTSPSTQTNYVWTPFNLTGGNNGIGGATFAIFVNGAWVLSHQP
jgi:hypothetical protein